MEVVPIVPPLKSTSIEHRAQKYLRLYYPECLHGKKPVPVDHFFEIVIPSLVSIETSYANLESLGITNAEGYTNATEKVSIVDQLLADDMSISGTRRFRATVGHESGHCILHVPVQHWQASRQKIGLGLKRERSALRPFEDPEWQAWRFCHAFCMPHQAVDEAVKHYGTGRVAIATMAEIFDMNPAFVVSRLKMLKKIPANRGGSGEKFARNPKCTGNLAQPWQRYTNS